VKLYYGIWCEVQGGANGPRHFWFRSNDGAYKRFTTREEAAVEAESMNGPNARYTAAILGDDETLGDD
jgi:hypothetical protein